MDSAPAAILEQAGQLKDILWSVNFFQEDEAERMPQTTQGKRNNWNRRAEKHPRLRDVTFFFKLYVVSFVF